jgi:hypothetical protein
MSNLSLWRMPDDWSQVFTFAQLNRLSDSYARHSFYLRWYETSGVFFGEIFSTYTYFRECGLKMPRKMEQKNVRADNNAGNNNRGARGNAEWRWINITLRDEDISILATSDATLEYLATCAVVLADDGIGFKIEPADEGKSIRCTIYRPNMGDGNVIVGVSSYSSTVRDTLLACLYKLDTYLGGDFSTIPDEIVHKSERPRFR